MPLSPKNKQTGLPLPLPVAKPTPAKIDEKKLAAVKEYVTGIKDITGVAGDVALRAFAEGVGMDFVITNNEMVAQVRPNGDTGLYIDGKPISDKDTTEIVRGYLKEEYKSQDKEQKSKKP